MFSLKSSFGSFRSTTSTSTTRSFHEQDRRRIEDLEQQLQSLSNTAAKALDRVSELETELQRTTSSPFMATRSSSNWSISSDSSNSERLEKLEVALAAIHHARSQLSSPEHYRYI